MAAAPNGDHSEIDAFNRAASAIGRVVWTFFAFLFVLVVWSVSTRALLNAHQVWSYAVFAVTTVLFIAAVAGLRVIWRDCRYW